MVEIFVFNRMDVEDVSSHDFHIFISIADVGSFHPNIKQTENCRGVLEIQFDDVDVDIPYDDIPADVLGSNYMFTLEQAKEIIDFVDDADPQKIIVHCNLGMSRSPAIAAGLYNYFDQDNDAREIFTCGKYKPNGHVFRAINNVIGKKQWQLKL